jgi:hypothetical protein
MFLGEYPIWRQQFNKHAKVIDLFELKNKENIESQKKNMKKLCIVGINYGEKYQSFIPFYIYSALINYPKYSVLVFSENKMSSNVRKMLDIIGDIGDYEVVENYGFGLENNQRIAPYTDSKRAIRWLFFDDRFNGYEAIYFGDIDILFCKEKGGIYHQHLKHCETLGLPYSNYIRASAKILNFGLKHAIYYLINGRYQLVISRLKKSVIEQNKFSGLHFVKTREYFEKIIPHIPYYLNLITENHGIINLMNDEAILFDLIARSGLGLPPISPSTPDLDNLHHDNIGFRPHHGIHLGIFRSQKNMINESQVLKSYVYESYYKQYRQMKKHDPVFNKIISLADPFVVNLIKTMESYYTD